MANGFNFTAADITAEKLTPRLDPARFFVAEDAGAIVGPLAAGLLVDRASFAVALLVSAAIVGAAGLLGLTVPRPPARA